MHDMYDNHVSLSINCESTYQLRRITGQASANVFDWVVIPYPCLVNTITADFEGFFRWENLSLAGTGEYVIDVSFGLRYYHFFRVTG
jgi:Putative papain-like cysteine peptidase (DUF1796)